jgi:xylulose-5-phosphate/fructose-6-phosphate phosphoketolase
MKENSKKIGEQRNRITKPSDDRMTQVDAFWRAANYLGAAQLYLKENPLLREPLKPNHIKLRLLGHWGTQPGLNLIYAHLNRLIQDTDASILFIAGPGHGAPAVYASLYLEGTFGEYYPDLTYDIAGLTNLIRKFSLPNGNSSHLSPATPGAFHEGGELGYSLSHAFGAVFDNPNLIAVCVVGDGEAETGSLATSWHDNKFLNPATSGAVLPILHLNGYKISSATILGRLSERELFSLFNGYGYEVRMVEGDEPQIVHSDLWQALDWAYDKIRAIQEQSRGGDIPVSPAWPMIILRTPKGWTGPHEVDGLPVEGSFRSHQLPITDPIENPDHLKLLEKWLRSYMPENLFDQSGRPTSIVTSICPKGNERMGMNPHANGGELLKPLDLPDHSEYAVEVKSPGIIKAEATNELAKYIRDIFRATEETQNFRFFCPDETQSNRMGHIFEATDRAFMWPTRETDINLSPSGRVIEVLSEHICEGLLEGYLLTGRHGIFACYEAFIPIVDSMMNQYAKWLKVSREIPWRKPIASLNYLLTSHVWRQDHNGYSHQVPSFIDNLLNKKASTARIYLPPDANCLLSMMDHCLRSRDYVNLIVASKQPVFQWLDMKTAQEHCKRGASIWNGRVIVTIMNLILF